MFLRTQMTETLALLAAGAVALSMSGCASQLTAKQVRSEIKVAAPADTLIGDKVTVAFTGTLADKRTDPTVIRIQASEDGTTWKTVKQAADNGPKLALTFNTTAVAAGTTKFRATVSPDVKSKKPLIITSTRDSTVVDIKELTRKFFYDRSIAYQQSSAAGNAWDTLNDSPIYNRDAPGWISGKADSLAANFQETSVPDLTTISPDLTWMLKGSSCNAAMTVPPAGRTFIVTVAYGGTANGYPMPQGKSDVHVTLLDGKLVDYTQPCS